MGCEGRRRCLEGRDSRHRRLEEQPRRLEGPEDCCGRLKDRHGRLDILSLFSLICNADAGPFSILSSGMQGFASSLHSRTQNQKWTCMVTLIAVGFLLVSKTFPGFPTLGVQNCFF